MCLRPTSFPTLSKEEKLRTLTEKKHEWNKQFIHTSSARCNRERSSPDGKWVILTNAWRHTPSDMYEGYVDDNCYILFNIESPAFEQEVGRLAGTRRSKEVSTRGPHRQSSTSNEPKECRGLNLGQCSSGFRSKKST